MTLRHMQIFTAVCDCGSATAAAEKLGIAQPAVSLAVKELEDHYGVRLFDRISHKLLITAEGKELLRFARRILSLFDAAECDVKNWDSFGLLRVGSSITIGTCLMPEYVKRFRSAYPKMTVRVTVDNSAVIEKKILENQLDFALIEGIVHSDQIVSRRFMEDELVVICGADSAFSGRTELSLEELPDLPFLLREKGSGTRELFDSTMTIHNLSIEPVWESISTQAIIKAVAAGHGLSVLPHRLVKPDLENHRVRQLALKGIRFRRAFSMIYHKNKFLAKSAKEFMALCRDHDF